MTKYLKGNQSALIRFWWQALQVTERPSEGDNKRLHNPFSFDRGHRARLRRSTGLDDVARESAVWRLVEKLQMPDSDNEALMLVAGALAHVKDDTSDSKSLAYLLGVGPVGKDEKPRLNELRFQRLMREDDPDDFFQQLRRALAIGNQPTDVVVLAEDLLAWSMERRFANRRSDGMKFCWARDYYLKRPDQALIAEAPLAPLT